MSIPYRTQQNLKHLAIGLLILAVVGSIALSLWFVWLQRYVVYTRESGAVLDFQMESLPLNGQEALPDEDTMEIEIYYNEGDDKVTMSTELAQLNGYVMDASKVIRDPDAAWETIQKLPVGTPVILDVKSILGNFYYTTSTGRPISDSADVDGMDRLIANLSSSGYYTIARVPALRDREYGLSNTRAGLPTSGGYLWMDTEGCYWLNPTKEDTITYMMRIATELREMGFNEVLFSEYRFPDTSSIVFGGDKVLALSETAQTLVDSCATEYFAVSFVSDGTWTPPSGRSRIYMENISDPTKLGSIAQSIVLTNPTVRLVFLTNNMDTRYEEYGVMRAINLAH